MKNKKTQQGEVITTILILLLVLAVIVIVWQVVIDKSDTEVEFCITTEPTYLLMCQIDNERISATASNDNLQKALENNNCSIVDEFHQIDIVYCSQEFNETRGIKKYKILTSLN